MLKRTLGALFFAIACSHHQAEDPAPGRRADVMPQPRITIVTDDHPVMAGVMLIAPSITAGSGQVIAHASRHGSQCDTDVRGTVHLEGSRLDVHMQYVPRAGVMCSQIAKVLEYAATVSDVAPGQYTVHLYHTDESGPEHEVQSQQVTVR